MDERDKPHFEQILHQLELVDSWLARLDPDADHPGPAVGSPLHADDERTHPFETSQAAWHALSHAVDALHCLRSVLRDARVIHMYAPYALVRVGLENASAAVWMLHPRNRVERITRRLRLCADDIRNGTKAMGAVGHSTPRTQDERLEELRAIARNAGADPARVLSKSGGGYGEIVAKAGEALAPGAAFTTFMWRLCSGIAHGDFWTTLNAAERVELPGARDGMVSLKVTADVETLKVATANAVHMTMQGWQLHDQRGTAPY